MWTPWVYRLSLVCKGPPLAKPLDHVSPADVPRTMTGDKGLHSRVALGSGQVYDAGDFESLVGEVLRVWDRGENWKVPTMTVRDSHSCFGGEGTSCPTDKRADTLPLHY